MLDGGFARPRYGKDSFLALPQSVAGLLGRAPATPLADELSAALGGPFDRVLLFFVDSFGWRFYQQYADYPVLRRFAHDGIARKISAQFPSTTAAHVTTLHTGLSVGQHAVFEWHYYEPQLDAVYAPLLFSYAGTRTRDELKKNGIDPRPLLPQRTLYHDLAPLGIRARIHQHREFTPSTFSDILFDGAQAAPYITFPEVLTDLRLSLADPTTPEYLVAYFGNLDTINHRRGPSSPHGAAETDAFLLALERQFFAKVRGAGRTLVLLTADHGAVETDPKDAIYLNVDRRFAGFDRFLRRNRRGDILVPGGSPRDAFLYICDGLVDEAQAFLAERLDGIAQVLRVADLIADGFFGPQPLASVLAPRAGDLVILPFGGECVWWYEKNRFEQRFFGHHGGLTPQELEIPLLALAV